MDSASLEKAYALAKERYAEFGVDTDRALQRLRGIPVSVHCWQGDDVGGFETAEGLTGGGIMATGSYPGKARTPDELRSDAEKALSLIPGKHRFNLHAIYLESGGRPVERNRIEPVHFQRWIDWARQLHSPCVTNVWIPDGYKDVTIDRKGPRELLKESLDEIFADPIDAAYNRDAVESKLFGIGSETYVVGSHEFYLGYAMENKKLLCLDAGHFHPTETIADKISSVLMFLDEILLHVSRGIRWDSDHVVILTDDLRAIAEETVRGDFLDRVHIGLDFFDASINRVAAWVIGTRAMIKAVLSALLEPAEQFRRLEVAGDCASRLAMVETARMLPLGAVWDYYCLTQGVPVGMAWMDEVRDYEAKVTGKR